MTTWSDSFETGFGNWTNTSGWTRTNAATPSADTGPSTASTGSYFIYLEASNNSFSYQATLDFDQTLSGDARISFDYHMYGVDSGTLRLEAYVGSAWVHVWSNAEDQGNQWNSITNLAIPEGATDLRFIAGCAGNFASDVSLDNIVVEDGLTLDNSALSSFGTPVVEDFAGGATSKWTINDADIVVTSGGTPSSSTGPDGAPASDIYYCFIEGSNYADENTATMDLDTVLNGDGGHISFYVHRYGQQIGGLILEYSTDNKTTWNVLWADSGQVQTSSSDVWTEIAEFPYPENTTNLRFRFFNYGSNVYFEDYALGHIVVKEAAAGVGVFAIDNILQAHSVAIPPLDQLHSISTNDVAQAQSIDAQTIDQVHTLLTDAVNQGQSLDAPTIQLLTGLVIDSINQGQTLDNTVLEQLIALSVDSVNQAQTLGEPTFISVNLISIDDITQSQSIEGLSLSQLTALLVDSISQGQLINSVSFTKIKGKVNVTITMKKAGATFNGRMPSITFAGE